MALRGPLEGQGYRSGASEVWHWALGQQHLSIVDHAVAGNDAQLVKKDVAVAANGEIYNVRALYDMLPTPVGAQSESDSEVLTHLYREFGADFVPHLDGIFAFVLIDQEKGSFLAARDPCGIKPLYLGRSKGVDGRKLMFASELKCLVNECDDIEEFPQGTYYTPETGYVKYQPVFRKEGLLLDPKVSPTILRDWKCEQEVDAVAHQSDSTVLSSTTVDATNLNDGLRTSSFRDEKFAVQTAATAASSSKHTPASNLIPAGSGSVFTGKSRLQRPGYATSRTRANASSMSFEATVADLFEPNVDTRISDEAVQQMLLSGGDDRTFLDPETGRNSYHVGPVVFPDAIVRSSCTCNPLTPLASDVARIWQPRLAGAWPEEFSAIMENDVRGAIARSLDLPKGAGVLTAPSGTDIELIPVMMAKSFFPAAEHMRVVVAAMNEIGKGVALAAGGKHSSKAAPLGDKGILAGRSVFQLGNKEDVSSSIKLTELDARDCEGQYLDHSEVIAREITEGAACGEPTVVHTVYGTKTNTREPFPANTRCSDAEASTIVVVDACQGRYSRTELASLLEKGAVITITGSKAWSGPPFSGAILIPAQLMHRLQNVPEEDLWVPDMLGHYFTQDDIPRSLPALRARLPALQNRGLALRWLAALGEFDAYLAAGGDSKRGRSRVAEWGRAVCAEMKAKHPQLQAYEVNGSIINLKVMDAAGEPMKVDSLRSVYRLLTEVDLADQLHQLGIHLTKEEAAIANVKCLIGQPVKICNNFGIIRLALSCRDIRMLMEDMTVSLAVSTDAQVLCKISLIAKHSTKLGL